MASRISSRRPFSESGLHCTPDRTAPTLRLPELQTTRPTAGTISGSRKKARSSDSVSPSGRMPSVSGHAPPSEMLATTPYERARGGLSIVTVIARCGTTRTARSCITHLAALAPRCRDSSPKTPRLDPSSAWVNNKHTRNEYLLCDTGGLLLGQTVKGAQPPDQLHGVDSHDRPVPEELGENAQRDAVGGVVEGRDEDGGVGDVEICVAGREAPAVEHERRRHRETHHLGPRAVLQTHPLQALAVLLEGTVVRLAGILLPAEHERA